MQPFNGSPGRARGLNLIVVNCFDPSSTATATRSVLLVDDSDVYRRGMRRAIESDERLRLAGECSDGAEALRAIDDLLPEVLLLDLHMPVMDGLELCRRLDFDPPLRPVHIVLTSANFDRETVEIARMYGVTDLADKGLPRFDICNLLAARK